MSQQPESDDPATQCRRLGLQGIAIQGVSAAEPFCGPRCLASQPIEQLIVIAYELGSSRQGLGNPRTELGLQRWQHCLAYADAREPSIRVMRVLPRSESELGTYLLGGGAANWQEGPDEVTG